MTPATDLIPHLKALHVGLIALWVAGLVAMPQMLARHDRGTPAVDYGRIRQATHFGYVWALTPTAVLAIVTGGLLIFLREVFTLWLFGKLVLVAGLVGLHAWAGHTITAVAESDGSHEPPDALLPTLAMLALAGGILLLVLGKPDPGPLPLPDWLTTPQGRHLPFDAPSR